MRVLIVNKFFYPRGGDCIVAINTQRLLEANGHTVKVFAMNYPENLPIPDTSSYASQINFSGGITDKIKAFQRILGKGDIQKTFNDLLNDFKPDVVHLHNIHSYISPIVAELAHKFGAKVVWTLHDFKLICPAYTCRQPSGKICTECRTNLKAVISNRCMKNDLIQSIIAYIEALKWNRQRLETSTDVFIAPSQFMRQQMILSGFNPDKIVTICNFLDLEKIRALQQHISNSFDDFFCYIGRLSHEKGVKTLLEAAVKTNIKLKIAGDGPLKLELEEAYKSKKNIEFLGHLNALNILSLLSKAKASIIPSEWYENNPLGVIESLSVGTPVIGADIGGIPELITDNNGLIFQSGNIDDLVCKIANFDTHKFNREKIAQTSLSRFSEKSHYKLLLQTYQK